MIVIGMAVVIMLIILYKKGYIGGKALNDDKEEEETGNEEEETTEKDGNDNETNEFLTEIEEEEQKRIIIDGIEKKLSDSMEKMTLGKIQQYKHSVVLTNAMKIIRMDAFDALSDTINNMPLSALQPIDCVRIVRNVVENMTELANHDVIDYQEQLKKSKDKLITAVMRDAQIYLTSLTKSLSNVRAEQVRIGIMRKLEVEVIQEIICVEEKTPDKIIEKAAKLVAQVRASALVCVRRLFSDLGDDNCTVNLYGKAIGTDGSVFLQI